MADRKLHDDDIFLGKDVATGKEYWASQGRKFDQEKDRWHLVQPLFLREYVKVLTYGAKKYDEDNWRKVQPRRKRYFAALMRHVWSWWLGEKVDHETGRHHLAHAACCLAFLAEPEIEEMWICKHCGALNEKDDVVCRQCGEHDPDKEGQR